MRNVPHPCRAERSKPAESEFSANISFSWSSGVGWKIFAANTFFYASPSIAEKSFAFFACANSKPPVGKLNGDDFSQYLF